MKNDKEKNEPSLTEKHALNRLNKVEKDRQKAYSKKNNDHSWQTVVTIIIFIIIVIIMLFSMKF